MILITDLGPGDEIIGYMRLGLALEVVRRKDGVLHRSVPEKPQKAGPTAITKFRGTVLENNTSTQVLRVSTVGVDHKYQPLPFSSGMVAEISYTTLDRVLLFSPFNYEARDPVHRTGSAYRPTILGLTGTLYYPYRTLVNVKL